MVIFKSWFCVKPTSWAVEFPKLHIPKSSGDFPSCVQKSLSLYSRLTVLNLVSCAALKGRCCLHLRLFGIPVDI